MASIAKRPDGQWRARYRDDDGRERPRHFDRKVDAQRWLDEVTATLVGGTYVDPTLGRQTFQAYASALIRSGLSVRVVSERLGHANAAMTLNVYAHLWPDEEDRTRRALDELLGDPGHTPHQEPPTGSRKHGGQDRLGAPGQRC